MLKLNVLFSVVSVLPHSAVGTDDAIAQLDLDGMAE